MLYINLLFTLLLIFPSTIHCKHQINSYANCDVVIVGAGYGGVFAAHSLMNSTTVDPSRICIFESNNRPGGRTFSVYNDEGRLMFEAGAKGHGEGGNNPIMDTIAKAFNISTTCEAFLDEDCGDSGYKYFFKARGSGKLQNQRKGTQNSSKIPWYFFWSNEQYQTEDGFDSPWSRLEEAFPYLGENENKLDSGPGRKAWKAMRNGFNLLRNSTVPGTTLKYTEVDFLNGLFDSLTGVKKNYSPEFQHAILHVVDEAEADTTSWLYHVTQYLLHGEELAGSGPSEDVVFDDGDGNPIGYLAPIAAMLNNFTSHGGRIFYSHRIGSVKRDTYNNTLFAVEGASANLQNLYDAFTLHDVQYVIWNGGVDSLSSLSKSGIPWIEASFDFEKLLQTWSYVEAQKVFLHYEDPWWIRYLGVEWTSNAVTTDEALKYFETSQTYPDCNMDVWEVDYCPVWTCVSYTNGKEYTSYWDSANFNRTENQPIWLNYGDKTEQYLREAHMQYLWVYENKLLNAGVNLSDIPLPTRGAAMTWKNGWAYVRTNEYNGHHNRMMRAPLIDIGSNYQPGKGFFIANTDFSVTPGEANPSLWSVLEVLKLGWNLELPEYDPDFYRLVINHFF